MKLIRFVVFADCASCDNTKTRVDFVAVELGGTVTLNCTYNCSSGFIRSYWEKEPDNSSACGTISSTTMCTTSLCLSNVSANDLNKNYTCYTEDTADPNLSKKPECIFSLHRPGKAKVKLFFFFLPKITKIFFPI